MIYLKYWKEKTNKPANQNALPGKVVLHEGHGEGHDKHFPNKKNQREFITPSFALLEMLTGILQIETKGYY